MNPFADLLFVADRRFVLLEDGRLDAGEATPAQIAALAATARERKGAAPVADGLAQTAPGPVPDADTARLLSALRRGTYLDYATDAATDVDESIMRTYLADEPPPPSETTWNGPLAWLPHPAFGTGGPRSAGGARTRDIAQLLLSGFGHLRTVSFLDLFDVVLKPVPSKGARHPFDAYITVDPDAAWSGLAPGTYRYVPSLHALEYLEDAPADDYDHRADQKPSAGTAVGLVVVAVFERVQWRYREPAGYRDLYLDLGHLSATLAAVAADASLRLTPVEQLHDGAWATAPEHEAVAAYRLEPET